MWITEKFGGKKKKVMILKAAQWLAGDLWRPEKQRSQPELNKVLHSGDITEEEMLHHYPERDRHPQFMWGSFSDCYRELSERTEQRAVYINVCTNIRHKHNLNVL